MAAIRNGKIQSNDRFGLKFEAKVRNYLISSKKNFVEIVDKIMSTTSTSTFLPNFIEEMGYLIAITQYSKSFAFPSFPVSFLYILLFSFEV